MTDNEKNFLSYAVMNYTSLTEEMIQLTKELLIELSKEVKMDIEKEDRKTQKKLRKLQLYYDLIDERILKSELYYNNSEINCR